MMLKLSLVLLKNIFGCGTKVNIADLNWFNFAFLIIFLSNVDDLDEHHQNYHAINTGFLF